MEDARSDSFEPSRVEGRLKEFSDERDARDFHEEIVASMDESDAHQRYCEDMKNFGDPAYQDVDIFVPGVSAPEKVRVIAELADLFARMHEGEDKRNPTPLEVPKKAEPKNRAERRAAKRKMKGSCPLRLV